MKKICFLLLGLLFGGTYLKAQQYALFGTRTLFDAFENPAIKSFVLDSSSKYASNFLFPNLSFNTANRGDATDVIRRLINEEKFNTSDLSIGNGIPNLAFEQSNIYLLTLKIFSHYKYNQELGIAWQVRSDAVLKYTNEGLAILDGYERFSEILSQDVFQTHGYQQSYHQFSFSVRENWDKKLSFGAKFSLLSGIAYNDIHIDNSYIIADVPDDRLNIHLAGSYRGSFLYKDEISRRTFLPLFKNPGASISLGTTYNSKSGYFIMGNIKDLGFIKWNKKSHVAKFNVLKSLSPASTSDINKELIGILDNNKEQKGFYAPTNAKADFMIARSFNFYNPSLIISKNLFHSGGDVAIANTFKWNRLSASLTPTYNFNDFILFGVQGMYKTPNFEFFLGTDNIGKTIYFAQGIDQADATIGTGYNGASFYMGLGLKFGKVVNHPMNLSTMPGVNNEKPYKGFFRSLFTLFQRKEY
jgi:hypothetical protein